MTQLPVFEGGRAREAKDVLDHFANSTLAVTTQCSDMSGFVVIAWDDHGVPTTARHLGKNNPVPFMMIPDIVRDILKTELFQ